MDEGEESFDVEVLQGGQYRTSFHVSGHYLGSIIGTKGIVVKRIASDTKTEIKIPRQSETGDIVITGPTKSSVCRARRQINNIVTSSRMKKRPTHFISIPLNTPEIIENFKKLKELILNDQSYGISDEAIFTKPEKIHITIGMVTLMDDEERSEACKLLEDIKPKVSTFLKNPMKIQVKGVSYMNDDPSAIDVLYGTVLDVPGNMLQQLVDLIADHFIQAGAMRKESDHVKLHMTLMNTKLLQKNKIPDESGGHRSNWRREKRVPFDGSKILEDFKDYYFGEIELHTIHLSERHAFGSDGYYQPTSSISF